jgi:hypothetical protein
VNSNDYLRRLKLALADHPERDDIVGDIAEHFSSGVASGRSEAQIAARLQAPERLARAYRAQALARNGRPFPGIVLSLRLLRAASADRFRRLPPLRRFRVSALAVSAFLALVALALAMFGRSPTVLVGGEAELRLPAPPAQWYLLALIAIVGGIAALIAAWAGLRRAGGRAREYLLKSDPTAGNTGGK